jgi:hypothetical protein
MLRDGEQVLDYAPAHALHRPDGIHGGRGVLLLTNERLIFGHLDGWPTALSWTRISGLNQRHRRRDVVIEVTTKSRVVTTFTVDRSFAAHVDDFWTALRRTPPLSI